MDLSFHMRSPHVNLLCPKGGETNRKTETLKCHQMIPRPRKLVGPSAQIGSGMCRCGSQEQVPEIKFRRVPVCAGVGSGSRLRKVPGRFPEGSGVWGKFRRVPESSSGSEGSGEFWCGLLSCDFDRSRHVIVLRTLW